MGPKQKRWFQYFLSMFVAGVMVALMAPWLAILAVPAGTTESELRELSDGLFYGGVVLAGIFGAMTLGMYAGRG